MNNQFEDKDPIQKPDFTVPQRGWLCPTCGTSNAPFMPMCIGCKPQTERRPDWLPPELKC